MKIKKWKRRVAMALCVAMTGILVGCGATGEEKAPWICPKPAEKILLLY